MDDEKKNVRLRITGAVQGVGFRQFALGTAREFAIVGWVRNLPDGSVEIQATGEDEALQTFAEKLGEGPPSAEVKEVKAEVLKHVPRWRRFEVRY